MAEWPITAQAEPPPRQVFRRVLPLTLPGPPPGAEAARVAEAAAELRGTFLPLSYDALAPPDPALAAALEEAPEGPVVVLDSARQVVSIEIVGSGRGDAFEIDDGRGRSDRTGRRVPDGELALHRIDGQAVSEMPTATGEVRSGAARFGEPFVADRFAVRGALAPDDRAPRVADVASLRVTSPVTGPRLGLAHPSEPAAAAYFWRGAPAAGSETVALSAGADFRRALEAHLNDRLAEAASGPEGAPAAEAGAGLEVALVAEADAPCRLELEPLEIEVTWVVRGFAGGGSKRVLRTGGPGPVPEAPALALPAGSRLVRASLRVDASLDPERLAEGGEPGEEALEARRGALLTAERWVGVPVARDAALVATGVGIPLLALSRDARLRLELHADAGGVPAGAPLAAAELAAGPAGVALWHHPAFAEPVTISSAPHWLLARASRGSALWLARPEGGAATLFESPAPRGAWRRLEGGGEAAPLYRFTSNARALREAPGVTLAIGGRAATGERQDDGSVAFDLTEPLIARLAEPAGAAGEIPLELATDAGGILTVYSPEIEVATGP